jgi:hypothetical protein
LIWRSAAVLLVPGLDWSVWAALLAGVAAAALFVLLSNASRFNEGEITDRLEKALVVVLNVGFVALAAGVLKQMGAPLWMAIPLGGVAVALAYIGQMVLYGGTLIEAMVLFTILSALASLILPIFVDLRQKARTAYELRHHRPTLQAPPRSAPRDSATPTAPSSKQPQTGTVERSLMSPAAPHTADP